MQDILERGNVAVVTGGASGIGLAVVARLAAAGMRVAMVDLPGEKLDDAERRFSGADVRAFGCDVSSVSELEGIERRISEEMGPVRFLMNNAGIQPGSSIFDETGNWERILATNLWGVIRSSQVFAPRMIRSGLACVIVNTGSKQGITTPPGDPAYNVSKSGVKTFTEALQHELRNIDGNRTQARLFIPGWVFTPLTAHGQTDKPDGAWTPEQVTDFLFEALHREDFYILCPDNDVDRATDEKRILWAAGDITENRPPLSRWHPDYGDAFAKWLKS